LNTLGKLNAFEKILQRLKSSETDPTELIRLTLYCECFALSSPLFNKNFVLQFFPLFEEAVK
jgi:hypothetical protein